MNTQKKLQSQQLGLQPQLLGSDSLHHSLLQHLTRTSHCPSTAYTAPSLCFRKLAKGLNIGIM